MNTATGSLNSNALSTKPFRASDKTQSEDDDVVIPDIAFNGDRVLFIGREDPREGGQHMNFENSLVSEKQAMIYKEDGRFVILDYELDFGTLLNTRLVADPLPISDNDVLSIGLENRKLLRYSLREFAALQMHLELLAPQCPVAYQFVVNVTEEGIILKHLRGPRATPVERELS